MGTGGSFFFFFGEGCPQQKLRTHRSLDLQPCDEDKKKDDQFFSLFQVMEHRWNDIDRGKPKYWGKTCPSATLSTTNPTWTDP
jgi:hypothetical protein